MEADVVWPQRGPGWCNFPFAAAYVSQPKLTEYIWSQIGLSEEARDEKLKEVTEFPQHSCDDFALEKGHVTWTTTNIA